MELLSLLNAHEIIAQIISFLILLFILRLVAWKRVLAFLDSRKERIAGQLRDAENAALTAQKIRTDYELKLSKIDDEASRRIKQAVDEGRQLQDDLKKYAHLEAQKIIDEARANIKYELSKAKEDLKEKIIDLSILAAESAIQEKLTEKQDRKLIKDFLDKIEI